MSDFKTIETQEELDAIIKARVAREREKFGDYDQLKERVTQLETENGVLKANAEASKNAVAESENKLAEMEKKVAGYETNQLRTRVALANGLPFDLADRLMGDDEASLTADAERLAGLIKPADVIAPLKNVEPNINQENSGWAAISRDFNKQGE